MFGGWYYVTEENVQAAEAAAAAGAWETLYKLFAGKFSGNSAVAEEDSQITVYAKWNEHACRDADSRAFRRTVAGAFRPPDARARNGDP